MDKKEAIKRLNRRINQLKLNFAITNEDLKAIETVLNLLEKKDKEIEKYKTLFVQSTAERVITSLKDSEKSKEDLKMLDAGWKIELEKKDIDIIETKEANRQLSIELQKKDKIIDELSTMVFDSRNLTFVDDKQFKDRKKEIIKYAEEQATGKAM